MPVNQFLSPDQTTFQGNDQVSQMLSPDNSDTTSSLDQPSAFNSSPSVGETIDESQLGQILGGSPVQVASANTGFTSPASPPTTLSSRLDYNNPNFLSARDAAGVDLLKGAGKGLISTLDNSQQLGQRLLKGTLKTLLPKKLEKYVVPQNDIVQAAPSSLKTPTNLAQKTGFVGEQIGEFFVPASKVAKAEKVLSTAPKLAQFFAKAGLQGAVSGGQTALQQGKVNDTVITNTLLSSAFSAGGQLLSPVGKALAPKLRGLGQKIENVIIKPSKSDLQNGYKVENLAKYNIKGPAPKMLSQTQNELNSTYGQLKDALTKSKGAGATINLDDAYRKTQEALIKNSSKSGNFGNQQAIGRQLKALQDEINIEIGRNADDLTKPAVVDILQGNLIKQGAGEQGAWRFGLSDPDSTAKELIYNTFYRTLKTDIENSAAASGQPAIQSLNRKLSELIPIKSALLKRMPVASRNEIMGLKPTMSMLAGMFNPIAWLYLGADKASKSGAVANWLIQRAGKLEAGISTPSLIPKLLTGANSAKKTLQNQQGNSDLFINQPDNTPSTPVGGTIDEMAFLNSIQ